MSTKYIPAMLLLLSAALSCSKTQEGVLYTSNSDDNKEIHFIQSSLEKEFPTDRTEGTVDVVIARPGNEGSYSVWLVNRGDNAQAFDVPEKVTIPDGEYSVTVPVTVDLGMLVMGGSMSTAIYISERDAAIGNNSAYVSQFSDEMEITVSYELTWEEYYRTDENGEQVRQLATYNYNLFYTGRSTGMEVDKAVGANIFRIHDWASGVSFRFILNEDNTCTVPAQSIGYFNSNYNEYVYVSDMAVYTGNDSAYSSYPCTYDGNGTFTFYLIYYVSAGYFAMGEETLVFETDETGSPLMAIEYDGIEETETGFSSPRLSFYTNSYVGSYKATVVSGDISANPERQAAVRQSLIDGQAPDIYPVLTFAQDNSQLWNIPAGNFTAVALAYDLDGEPCELYTLRFTCDPDDAYLPSAPSFEFYNDPSSTVYSPYSTLFWHLSLKNAVSMKYVCMRKDMFDYLYDYYGESMEEFLDSRGNEVNSQAIEAATGDEGLTTYFTSLAEGFEYTLAILVRNSFGDALVLSRTASTSGRTYEDFDRTRTMGDFLGAFSASGTGSVSSSSGSTSSSLQFRVDIAKKNDSQVLITGLSDMRDFSPVVTGYYDEEIHAIIIEPQSLGMYRSDYAHLGVSDGFSIYWGGSGLALGYIGDTIHLFAAPGATSRIYSYQFLLFSSPEASSATYLRESVGSKTYSNISMVPISLPSSSRSAASPSGGTVEILKVGDVSAESYRIGNLL